MRIGLLVVGLALLAALPVRAEPWAAGERIEPFSLEDQHGTVRHVDAGTRVVLFSRDMDGGDVLKRALEGVPEGFFAARGAAYVADISRMPGLVTRLFALPSMRRRPYPMLLDRDGATTARLPDAEGQATLIFLEDLRIERVVHAARPEELCEALGVPDAAAEEAEAAE
jgi:hypothetical protein